MAVVRRGPITDRQFSAVLRLLNIKNGEKLGVGVSGEAKSLALLALLTRAVGKENVVAFTVDHKLKHNSTNEAIKLQLSVAKLGIEHHIITPDWKQSGSGFRGDKKDPPLADHGTSPSYWTKGTAARIRRYAMLSRACKAKGIRTLLIGHHLDDQTRIGLSRLKKNSGIEGLTGMKMLQPEISGTTASAAKHVRLARPLLSFAQEQLVDICRDHGLEPNDTSKNHLRFLPTEDYGPMLAAAEEMNERLGAESPVRALSRISYARFMEHMEIHRNAFKAKVTPLLEEHTLRDPPTGTCFLHVRANRNNLQNHWISQPYLAERVLAHVVKWAGNGSNVPASTVPSALREQILNYFKYNSRLVNGGGVILCPPRASQTGAFVWVVARSPIQRSEFTKNAVQLRIGERAIWDQRFLIALRAPQFASVKETFYGVDPQDLIFVVRPFTDRDYHSILDRMRTGPRTEWNESVQQALTHYWQKMPPPARQTIPCIALKQDSGDTSYVISVPSISINLEPQLLDVQFSFANHSAFEREGEEIGFRLIERVDDNS
ncbi:uncharacterized protein SPPG_03819 [Spizellomyces punctatus DAOM BR117]|uniref:tRNA(Ile)-lysidine synthetase n=1 Tax=Spizellomyces punctatus (strain DAOM BR117) TaxID=645134 RepID=A0A0L0HHY0_SPIPD|nr:uncharacterized protein SPPG_03819 [Spizellomyces punctatus DAOM BR117]KND00698.1 hypothetical protein SPPG_03819 [Spizellomyces punctatus DAOM BR117]|eukprot:XP_016608737.1 hypothetical protein SPPG_03819 [Spizellomyces punctatus DAOM BR117]